MKVLVTGASGFTARYLITYLRENSRARIYLSSLEENDELDWRRVDLAHPDASAALIEEIRPDQVFHLAGRFTNDYQTDYSANVLTTRNLLEGILKAKLQCRVMLFGSSAEYGAAGETESPIREDHPLAPVSTYGLTKVYQTHLMKFYCATHRMDLVMARPFNLMGEGASVRLFVGHLLKQIDEYKRGLIAKISLGNLENRRDYLDAALAVRYYETIMQRGAAGEVYNVGSGGSIRLRDLLRRILEESSLGMEVVEESELVDPNKFDIRDIFADIGKLRSLTQAGDVDQQRE